MLVCRTTLRTLLIIDLLLNRSFSSFPDSAQFKEGSSVHSFRFRWSPPGQTVINDQTLTSDGFIYGFSYFSRKKDKTSARGYDQVNINLYITNYLLTYFPAIISVSYLSPLAFLLHGSHAQTRTDVYGAWGSYARIGVS